MTSKSTFLFTSRILQTNPLAKLEQGCALVSVISSASREILTVLRFYRCPSPPIQQKSLVQSIDEGVIVTGKCAIKPLTLSWM